MMFRRPWLAMILGLLLVAAPTLARAQFAQFGTGPGAQFTKFGGAGGGGGGGGPAFYEGTTTPTGGVGNDGDSFFNYAASILYLRTAGSWGVTAQGGVAQYGNGIGGTYQSTPMLAAQNILTRLHASPTLEDFGGYGDGVLHPLSTVTDLIYGTPVLRFANFAAVQAYYPGSAGSFLTSGNWTTYDANSAAAQYIWNSQFAAGDQGLVTLNCGSTYEFGQTITTQNYNGFTGCGMGSSIVRQNTVVGSPPAFPLLLIGQPKNGSTPATVSQHNTFRNMTFDGGFGPGNCGEFPCGWPTYTQTFTGGDYATPAYQPAFWRAWATGLTPYSVGQMIETFPAGALEPSIWVLTASTGGGHQANTGNGPTCSPCVANTTTATDGALTWTFLNYLNLIRSTTISGDTEALVYIGELGDYTHFDGVELTESIRSFQDQGSFGLFENGYCHNVFSPCYHTQGAIDSSLDAVTWGQNVYIGGVLQTGSAAHTNGAVRTVRGVTFRNNLITHAGLVDNGYFPTGYGGGYGGGSNNYLAMTGIGSVNYPISNAAGTAQWGATGIQATGACGALALVINASGNVTTNTTGLPNCIGDNDYITTEGLHTTTWYDGNTVYGGDMNQNVQAQCAGTTCYELQPGDQDDRFTNNYITGSFENSIQAGGLDGVLITGNHLTYSFDQPQTGATQSSGGVGTGIACTLSGGAITALSWSGGTTTATVASIPSGVTTGSTVVVIGVRPIGYVGVFSSVTVTGLNISWAQATNPGLETTLGTIGLANTTSSCVNLAGIYTQNLKWRSHANISGRGLLHATIVGNVLSGWPGKYTAPVGNTATVYDADEEFGVQLGCQSENGLPNQPGDDVLIEGNSFSDITRFSVTTPDPILANSGQTSWIDSSGTGCAPTRTHVFYNTGRDDRTTSVVISGLTWSGGVATVTTVSPHMVQVGYTEPVTITGMTPTGYNGQVPATATSTTQFTFPLTSNPGTATVFGTVTGSVAYNGPPTNPLAAQRFGIDLSGTGGGSQVIGNSLPGGTGQNGLPGQDYVPVTGDIDVLPYVSYVTPNAGVFTAQVTAPAYVGGSFGPPYGITGYTVSSPPSGDYSACPKINVSGTPTLAATPVSSGCAIVDLSIGTGPCTSACTTFTQSATPANPWQADTLTMSPTSANCLIYPQVSIAVSAGLITSFSLVNGGICPNTPDQTATPIVWTPSIAGNGDGSFAFNPGWGLLGVINGPPAYGGQGYASTPAITAVSFGNSPCIGGSFVNGVCTGGTQTFTSATVTANGLSNTASVTATSLNPGGSAIMAGGHIVSTGGGTPTCGTGCASITGTDNRFVVTSGSAVTSVAVNFGTAFGSAPVCTVSTNSLTATGDISAISASAVTLGLSVALTGGLLYVTCTG